ncbi:non-functional pseudokinase ZED1 [Ricinus communis]|nr:non-functional pseudokinase ZED1 [Ricinus communis]|eukprot:XP_002512392.2 non-functional pseudokinase ZED1 [Ricinus communis]
MDENETALMRNGGILLEKSIAFNNGRGNPIRWFSVDELQTATNSYSQNNVIYEGGWHTLYKGFLRDRPVIVKRYRNNIHERVCPINDIVFASEMSRHKNVLKLLGCCLESEIPILVFEYAEKGKLQDYIYKTDSASFRPLLWKSRLKIAVDAANVIAYLHTACPRPVVHRDITLSNIWLDEDYVAKVTDFTVSMSILEGETHIEDFVLGTCGYAAPEYVRSGIFNEKIDVFSFGVLLLVLLTDQKPFQGNWENILKDARFDEIIGSLIVEKGLWSEKEQLETFLTRTRQKLDLTIDPIIVEEGPWPEKEQQLKAFLMLGVQCIDPDEENRPEITDVAKQLRHFYLSYF